MRLVSGSVRARCVLLLLATSFPALALAQSADLQINKSGPATSAGGASFTYTLVMDNNGPASADGSTFADTMPPGVTNVTASCLGALNGATCPTGMSVSDASVSGAIANLPNLGKVTLQIQGKFPISGPTSLTNVATISTPGGVTDPLPASNISSISTAMSYSADLVVTKTQTPDTFTSGAAVSYVVTIVNNGAAAADGAAIRDNISANGTGIYTALAATFQGCFAAGGAICPANASFINYVGPPNPAVLFDTTIPVLPSGGSVTITYSVTATSSTPPCGTAAGEISNTITAFPPSGVSDPNGGFAIVTLSTPAASDCPIALLTVSKSVNPTTFTAGIPFTYTISFTNGGPAPADGARITDVLSSSGGAQAINLVVGAGTCSASGGAVCPAPSSFQAYTGTAPPSGRTLFDTPIPSFPVGGSITITYTIVPGAVACGPIGNLRNFASIVPPAGVTAPGGGSSQGVDLATPAGPTCAGADLAVTKTQSPSTFAQGTPITYTITYLNNGPLAANGAAIDDSLQGTGPFFDDNATYALTYVSCVPANGAACPADANFFSSNGGFNGFDTIDLYFASIPTLPVGGSITITYSMIATVPNIACQSGGTGDLLNIANIHTPAGVTDPLPANNQATVSLSVACSDISVNKTVTPNTVTSGTPVVYAIDVTNAGPIATSDVAFADPLPDGFVYLNASCTVVTPPAACGTVAYDASTRTVSSTITSIGNAGKVRFTIDGTAGATPGTYPNTATAAVNSATLDPIASSNSSFVNLQIFNTSSPITVTKRILALPEGGFSSPLTFSGTIACGSQPAQAWSATVAAGASTGSSSPLTFYDGETCTTTESTPPTPPDGYAWIGSPSITPNPTPPLGVSTPLTITVDNTIQRLTGGLILIKEITGPAAGVGAVTGNFDFSIDCGVDGLFAATIGISNGVSASTTVAPLPAAAICSVSETATAATPANYSWGAPSYVTNPVTIPVDSNASLSVTNPLSANPGTLAINKTVSGGPAAGVVGSFVFAVSCTPSNTLIPNQTVVLSNATSGSVLVGGIPAGDSCTVAELAPLPTPPTGYTYGAIPAPSVSGVLSPGGSISTTTANTLTANPGTLIINKTVGGGPIGGVIGAFVFAVSCTPSNTPIPNQTVILSGATSSSVTVSGIPAGDTCMVTEQAPLPAAPTDYTYGAIPPPSVSGVLSPGGNINTTIANTLSANPGTLIINKTVSGGPIGGVTGSFVFAVSCAPSNTPIPNQTVILSNTTSGSTTVGSVPTGDTCTVTELAPLPPPPSGYAYGAIPAPSVSGVLSPGGNISTTTANTLDANQLPVISAPVPTLDRRVLALLALLIAMFGALGAATAARRMR